MHSQNIDWLKEVDMLEDRRCLVVFFDVWYTCIAVASNPMWDSLIYN